ncbi:glycosyltransferase family 2 protein [Nodosilinea sp. PGN35]|uniref:glycosyltransferase family 2 protein n=1 Tax=Nodosilinea sp. PGN35 TaxID=3020489 RepID=UPI0023B35754|nr:glycosyltransferase family A protein [Nodosilinea sp. TSF1-S3]MDF0367333.1 glycosyltransferase family A protein [Nodosilinea sp. TSF1-S3]
MSNTPLVSIIIIFLNGESFLAEAIDSVFAQTYTNWELLLVDDGSTDKSTTIAQGYAQQYPDKVRYLDHEGHQNLGMSAARNLGIRHIKGSFIGFLDADDIWLPQKLEQQLDIFSRHPEAALVYGRAQIWYSWSEQAEDQPKDFFYELGVSPNCLIKPPALLKQLLKNKYQTPIPSNVLIRREIFDEVGQFENSFRSMYEDQVFFSKVMLYLPVYVADAWWIKYRQHSQSCSAQSDQYSYYTTRLPFLTWVEQYLKTQPVQDTELFQLVERELWQCRHPRAAQFLNLLHHYSERLQHLVKLF